MPRTKIVTDESFRESGRSGGPGWTRERWDPVRFTGGQP